MNSFIFTTTNQVPPLCYDFSDVIDFLDETRVRRALGVKEGLEWQSCNMTVNRMFSGDWMREYQWTV